VISIGLERIVTDQKDLLRGRQFSLVMNRASVDQTVRLACDVLADSFPGQLRALLSPQHGLWCEQQANMIETAHGRHRSLGIPVFSLYSETRRPTIDMLTDNECLIIDLQDVGTRVYTFIWTMLYCIQECAAREIPVIVLDRPNPLGGEIAEGPQLDLQYRSFVGESSIPMRHGLTIGELALWFHATHNLQADLTVVPMTGWQRTMPFESTGRLWIPTSPNMPTVQTAFVYPGQVLLEGTNLSEGRGTAVPFEIVGAPFIDPEEFCETIQRCRIPGVQFLPLRFTPAFDKWAGKSCGGVSIHVTDRQVFRSYQMTVEILQCCRQLYPNAFCFNPPPYEYEVTLPPIDIISGSDQLRNAVENSSDPADAINLNEASWWNCVAPFLLYEKQ
jgi:uncharacterized protein YbbC (DUF1343 family)